MNIKKYEGQNEQELMNKIKEELGPNAIILNIKTVKAKGIMKFFIKDTVQITVAVDDAKGLEKDSDYSLDEIKFKMNSMEKILASTANQMSQLYKLASHEAKTDFLGNKTIKIIYDHLRDQEVEHDVAMSLLEGTENANYNTSIQEIVRVVYSNICNMIGEVNIIDKDISFENSPQIIFFIGPTGVGKTTSIAKLTADFSLKKEYEVGLITADTYRIAAIDQLRTYAEILSIPLKVVYSSEELLDGIESFKHKDFIFIDTAGRSHKNEEQFLELQGILDAFPYKKIYIVLSATTKFKDIMSIIKKYSSICEEYSIIITKTDETTSVGTMLNLRYYIDKPLSYVSFGQNVPDDIEVVDGGKYAKILLGSLENE